MSRDYRREKEELRGYEWARSAHTVEGMTIEEIDDKIEFAVDRTDFDRGAGRFTREFTRKQIISETGEE